MVPVRMHMHDYSYLAYLEDGVRDFSAELCPKPAIQTRVKRETFRSRKVSTEPGSSSSRCQQSHQRRHLYLDDQTKSYAD